MLEIRALEVSYGPVRAVRGIDINVKMGEVVALIGPNGAGKTSTLRAISGLVPYKGTVTFDGKDCRKLNLEQLARAGLIHVPEGRHVFPTLDVHENLQLGTTAGAGRHEGFSIDDVYDLFPPLQQLRKRDGWALSGGEQQMVAIGRALVATAARAALGRAVAGPVAEVHAGRLLRVVAGGRPHPDAPRGAEHRDGADALHRAAVMFAGKLVLEGTAAEVADREALVASYLGEELALNREEAALRRDGGVSESPTRG